MKVRKTLSWIAAAVLSLAIACSGDSDENNGNNANNSNNANNVNNANNANNFNNVNNLANNTNNMVAPNSQMGNTNQSFNEALEQYATPFCTFAVPCSDDFADQQECESDVVNSVEGFSVCAEADQTALADCLTMLDGLTCQTDPFDELPEICDDVFSDEPCAEACTDAEVFVTDRGDGLGGCFDPCVDNACDLIGQTCVEGGCAFIECSLDVDCPLTQVCDQAEFVCIPE